MTLTDLLELAQALPAACTESPFGPESLCVRLGEHGRIFASFMPMPGWVSFKCEPHQALDWRQQYPGTVRRGWHCPPVQQPYNNTVTLDGTVPDAVLRQMLFHSYDQAVDSLSRTARTDLLGTFRPYTAEDEALVQGWIDSEHTWWRWCAGNVGSWPMRPGMLNASIQQRSTGESLLWLWQGQPAGFLRLFPQNDRPDGIHLGFVALNPAMRGQGLGKRMLACAVHHARSKRKARRLSLTVYRNNAAALHCYEANGFLVDAERPSRTDLCLGEEWVAVGMKR